MGNYFEDLEVWKTARELTNRIYGITADGSFSKDYGLRDQIRRAAVSVMSNIAEGYERGGNQELIQFLSIAKGSSGEVRSQLYVAMDQEYIDKRKSELLIDAFKKLPIMRLLQKSIIPLTLALSRQGRGLINKPLPRREGLGRVLI
ncbi:MAG: four helix bundle protein [Acetobacterium sp.]|nr:four helix bundle protein [Acetobacterium sp.]